MALQKLEGKYTVEVDVLYKQVGCVLLQEQPAVAGGKLISMIEKSETSL